MPLVRPFVRPRNGLDPMTRRRMLALSGAGLSAAALWPRVARAQEAGAPDLIVVEGNLVTQDPTRPQASALAVRGGLIQAVGDDEDMRALAGPDTKVIAAAGRTVIPGLNDSHLHATRGGRFYALELRWDGVGSLSRGIQMIAEQAARTPVGEWVRVIGGWSPYQFEEKRFPTPAELTEAAQDVPVFVLFLYSQGYLNAAGVRALGLTPDNIVQRAPEGTRYELTEDGGAILHATPNPNILYQTIGALPFLNAAAQELSTRYFYRELARFGLTSAIDAGGGGHIFPWDYVGTQALADAGEMPIRISNYLFPQKPGEELTAFRTWTEDFARNVDLAKRLAEGFVVEGGGEFLVWSAGDFENFMAPRPDLSERTGYDEELLDVTRLLLQASWPIRIHATYDESITLIMDVFERAHRLEREEGRPGFRGVRWAIDHAETVSAANLRRIAALGGGIAAQARMAYAGELFAERYGEEAASGAPPVADIIEHGIPLGLGTDATRIASYNPWAALDYFVTGRTVGGAQLMADRHRRSREEALWLYTVGSAWFSGEEALKGRLSPGQFADFAILSEDYLTVPDDAIAGIESQLTVVAGSARHAKGDYEGMAPELAPITPDWSPVATFGGYQG